MTKAEEMRKVTNRAIEKRQQASAERHHYYVQKLIDRKIRKRALASCSSCEIKVGRWYSPTLTVEAFEKMGFEVKRNSKNGKVILLVKW